MFTGGARVGKGWRLVLGLPWTRDEGVEVEKLKKKDLATGAASNSHVGRSSGSAAANTANGGVRRPRGKGSVPRGG